MEVVNTTRISEIHRNILRIYDEMTEDESTVRKIELTKIDKIKRLGQYYENLYELGEFKDPETGRRKELCEISRTILEEMSKPPRNFSDKTKWTVWKVLPDKYKRAWRTIPKDSKLEKSRIEDEDPEVVAVYNDALEHINEIAVFDYMELPKRYRLAIAERVYEVYKHHDKEWTRHGLQVVKHPQDDFSNLDPFAEIVSIEKGEPYEGELYDVYVELRKVIDEMCKKVKRDLKDKSGKRRISLEQEHMFANGVRVFIGYLKPHSNYKWKRDIYGWSRILWRRLELKSKSGAAKFSRKPVEIAELELKTWRGITREEIDKNQARLYKFFGQFIQHFPAMITLHQIFESISEPIRAEHSVKLHEKLSNRA